ncbi:MAG TPA: hypothetical protein VFV94_15670 [Polyangiaceae bacterium]|nr:hypothetical protein [Polyangiaceae bacterium]
MSAHVLSKASFLVAMAVVSCGGGAETAPPPSAPAPVPAPAPSPEPVASSAPPADSAATADAPPAAAPAEEAPAPSDAQRDIKYIQTPEGLRVEILGVKFVPKVEAVRTPAGFAVKVLVNATASEARTLLAPKAGPLAFAGSIKRAGKAEPETFGDERSGDGEQPLGEGTTVKLSREWPGKMKVQPLGNGDVLELDVALWGLGTSASDRRAVKQFFHVKAKVEKWKGSARVEVPPNMKGK